MKRLIVILGMVLMSVAVKAISWSYFYDGLWSEWSPRYFARASGNWHDFVISLIPQHFDLTLFISS